MTLMILVLIEYLVSIILSLIFAVIIIDKLYISKRFTKQEHFHHYNDLFSWEMFFFFIAIINILQLIPLFISLIPSVSNLIGRIRILIYFFPFWNKLIHLEKVMNKITYEKHYFAGLVPLILVILLAFVPISNMVIIFIFFIITFFPYLFLFMHSKYKMTTRRKMITVILGVTFIVIGFVLIPELVEYYGEVSDAINICINLSSATSFIIGDLLIFDSFRKELNSYNRSLPSSTVGSDPGR